MQINQALSTARPPELHFATLQISCALNDEHSHQFSSNLAKRCDKLSRTLYRHWPTLFRIFLQHISDTNAFTSNTVISLLLHFLFSPKMLSSSVVDLFHHFAAFTQERVRFMYQCADLWRTKSGLVPHFVVWVTFGPKHLPNAKTPLLRHNSNRKSGQTSQLEPY